jgi:phosphatidylinositol alpha-1,6-mannosyltransferase
MKILVFSPDFLPYSGGVAIFVHNICLQLCHQGHQVDVLTQGKGALDQSLPYRVFRYSPFKRLSFLVPVLKTFVLHFRNHYDLVFMGHFAAAPALGAWILGKFGNIPYIILSHGNDLSYSIHSGIDKMAAGFLLKNATLMLANSRFTAKKIREKGYKEALEILNPGIDEKQFHPGVDSSSICRKYDLKNKKVLFTAARLTAKKNIERILLALCKVIKRIPEVHYLIAGDGNERKRLEGLREKLGLNSHVRFLGNVSHNQLPAIYGASDVFILPSYEVRGNIETFGIAFLEASACGKPVIGGRCGGVEDAVIHGKTGLLVDPLNLDEISASIIQLLENQELAHQLGMNGRRKVKEELNLDKMGERLERYLCQVMK